MERTRVYVVPEGADAPRPLTPYALVYGDGTTRAGISDRRGAVVDPVGDPFWSQNLSNVTIWVVPNQPFIADLARFPRTKWFGANIDAYLSAGSAFVQYASQSSLNALGVW